MPWQSSEDVDSIQAWDALGPAGSQCCDQGLDSIAQQLGAQLMAVSEALTEQFRELMHVESVA